VELRDHAPQPYIRERSAAMLKIADGHSPHWVARQGLLRPRDPDTVYGWLNCLESEGIEGLCAHAHGGARRGSPSEAQSATLLEQLCHAPEPAPRAESSSVAAMPPPARWSLLVVRQHFDWLADYSVSGVWRVLRRLEIEWKHGYAQLWSPDPDYTTKVTSIEQCLQQAALDPRHVAALFMDEMGYYRWPNPSRDWIPTARGYPVAAHGACNNQQWRVIGALNARTARLSYRQNYIVGKEQIIAFYEQLNWQYRMLRKVFVIQDNWNLHTAPTVLDALRGMPRLEPVWLPTYASWLNPIEKVWRWLRQQVLHRHRLSVDWLELKRRVAQFFDQFAHGSAKLLKYVGLSGDGRWAKALRPHYRT
jgi:transposase